MKNIAFVNYYDFSSNSAIHIFHFANRLVDLGFDVAICVPNRKESASLIGSPRFRPLEYGELTHGLTFADGRGPDVVHAWTPRENVRAITEHLVALYGVPYVVHLEDNDIRIVEDMLGEPIARLRKRPPEHFDRLVNIDMDYLLHPLHYERFLAEASGISVIIDRLLEMAPSDRPHEIVWPAYDERFYNLPPPDRAVRRSLGVADDALLIVYPGNAHASNYQEVLSLYLAVALVNRHGRKLKLLRLGRNSLVLFDAHLDELREHVIDLGYRPSVEIADYLALADILVQPGRADPFNDYRLPAKLPEFLATGRPVILPRTNIGRHLEDGTNALLLDEGHALEIAEKIERLIDDPDLRRRLSDGAMTFAREKLSWERGAQQLVRLYERAIERSGADVAAPSASPKEIQE